MSERFMTVAEIAAEYACGLSTAYKIAKQCHPTSLPGGREIRVQRIDFENWIRKQRELRAWAQGRDHDSSDEDASGIAGSPGPKVGRGASPRTAPTRTPREKERANSSDEPRVRPIKPRTKPRYANSPIASLPRESARVEPRGRSTTTR